MAGADSLSPRFRSKSRSSSIAAGAFAWPKLNFSAAGAAVHWAGGAEWSDIVRQTRAEEGDLFRMFSRTGEALLQVAGLRRSHPQVAALAAVVAQMVLREPIR